MGTYLRILLVEDSEEHAGLLLREFRRGGYEIEFERVETADAMQAALARQPWDLVVSDFSLPIFSAPHALDVLKESGIDIPFIIWKIELTLA